MHSNILQILPRYYLSLGNEVYTKPPKTTSISTLKSSMPLNCPIYGNVNHDGPTPEEQRHDAAACTDVDALFKVAKHLTKLAAQITPPHAQLS
jgi:hypothetical protein